ncbi:MAG: C39 family peptidase [Planctomycetes bacterium]|nr:C39 family peptidase [Planctomycetota bacterium]
MKNYFTRMVVLGAVVVGGAAPGLPARARGEERGERARGSEYESVLIKDVPHVRQKPDFCGEACVEMVLRKLGKTYDQDYVFDASGLDPLLGRGCYTRDLTKAARAIGFDVGTVGRQVRVDHLKGDMEAQWAALHADLLRGVPSIICTRYDEQPETTEHFRLVLGYDAKTDEVLYHEPAADRGAYRRMARSKVLSLWPLKYDKKLWTVIRLKLKAGRLNTRRVQPGFTNADYAQHIMQLKKRLPHKDFTILLQKPFVVVGDDRPALVRRRATGTVQWAVDKLKQDYFKKDPKQIIDVWLFKDKESYEKHTVALWGEKPSTPYGYYSSQHKALVMNISTGGGTLVHEIVHPFIESNFPDCPSWFNEGLASLYEQSGERGGKIVGYTNWRLAGLQKAVRGEALPKFADLCSTTRSEFYTDRRGTNYAQARYLCYYLQQQGRLRKFYHQFVRDAGDDPTGYKTLQEVLGERDMAAFQQRFEKWALTLRYR